MSISSLSAFFQLVRLHEHSHDQHSFVPPGPFKLYFAILNPTLFQITAIKYRYCTAPLAGRFSRVSHDTGHFTRREVSGNGLK